MDKEIKLLSEWTTSTWEEMLSLYRKFRRMEDVEAVNSIILKDIFLFGNEGEAMVSQRIDRIPASGLRDMGRFRLVKLYYKEKGDLEAACSVIRDFEDAEEKAKCAVYLANTLLDDKMGKDIADNIVDMIDKRKKDHIKNYKGNHHVAKR